MSPRPHPVTLALLITVMVLAWTANFLVGKVGLKHLDPLTLASFRVVLAAVLLLGIYLASAKHTRLNRADLWMFAKLGLLGVAINQTFFIVGLNYTTVGHSSLIIATGPISTLLLARLQSLEALTTKKLLGMSLSFIGVAVLTAEHGMSLRSGTLRGDLITLTGSLAFATFTILAKKATARYSPMVIITFAHAVGAVILLPLALRQAVRLDWNAVPWAGWAALVYMAGIASALAYLIYYWCLRYLTASRLAAFSYLHPVLATLLGVAFLRERVTVHLIVGGALVLLGVYLTEIGPREASEQYEIEQTSPNA